MPPPRAFFCLAFLVPSGLAQAQTADIDTQCAATFTMLENQARVAGVSNGSFAAMAVRAQQAYLAAHPGIDSVHYAMEVAGSAQLMQQAVNSGTLDYNSLQTQVVACNARYAAAPQSY